MRKFSLVVGSLLIASSASAQPRPGAFTTVFTTDTSVASVCVGANSLSAPSTCLGGLQSGPTVVNLGLTLPSFTPAVTTNRLYNVGGTLTWNGSAVAVGGAVGPGTLNAIARFTGANSVGDSLLTQAGTVMTLAGTLVSNVFGASSFSAGGAGLQSLTVTNTSAGVANGAFVSIASNTVNLQLSSFSSTFTTIGSALQSGSRVLADGLAGLSIAATNAAGAIRFYTGGSVVVNGQIAANGAFQWTTFGTHSFIGSGVGGQLLAAQNTSAGAGNFGSVQAISDAITGQLSSYSTTFTTSGSAVQSGTRVAGNGDGGLSLAATHANGAVRIYTGSDTLRATYAANGAYSLGANLTDSMAVPTITSGFGAGSTISGRAHAFTITLGAASSGGIVGFNATFANIPVCVASTAATLITSMFFVVAPTTTGVGIGWTADTPAAPNTVSVICRGF